LTIRFYPDGGGLQTKINGCWLSGARPFGLAT
jgi:hypothetical protein